MGTVNLTRKHTSERESFDSHAIVTFGASGAPTLSRGKDVSSIARDSQGLYTLTLKEKFYELLGFSPVMESSSVDGGKVELASVDLSSKTIQFRVVKPTAAGDTTPAETDPDSGDKLRLHMVFSNTSLSY